MGSLAGGHSGGNAHAMLAAPREALPGVSSAPSKHVCTTCASCIRLLSLQGAATAVSTTAMQQPCSSQQPVSSLARPHLGSSGSWGLVVAGSGNSSLLPSMTLFMI
jgi:hypothetical protein